MLYKDYVNCRKGYQDYGRCFLLERKHACLFYKPGKGKTYPCVDAARDVDLAKFGKAKVLVLSTANAIKNMWLTEIKPQSIMPANTVYMSFNSAITDNNKPILLSTKWDIIIVDECHKVKSHNTKTSKLVHMLSKKAEYVWGLSGTPRGNSDVDIFCQFHNLCISEWGKISYTQFVNQCCDIDKKFFGGQMITIPVGINKKYQAGWERNIAMYTQRVDYDESDNMPDLDINLVELEYTPTKEYLQAEQGVISVCDYESTVTKLAAIQKLHQVVNGFLYIPSDDGRTTTNIEYNRKLDWIANSLEKKPTVIVYRFEEDLNRLIGLFKYNRSDLTYTEIVNDFKEGKADVLILQCSKAESFNLQMCNRVIFYTMDYSYICFDQMMHRVWRMGQESDVKVDVLTFGDTIETKIWNAVKNKKQLAQLFMDIKGV